MAAKTTPAKANAAIARSAATKVVETHFAILQLGVSIWNQWRASEPLTRPNLRNADLSGFHLENINFCRADLRQTNLSNAYLYDADFQDADLRGANLTRAGLIGANLHKANVSGAVVKHAYLAQSDLSQANFTGALLQKADLQSALVTRTVFTRARLAEAELTGSFDLTKAQLESARGVHLARFDTALKLELGLSPDEISDHEPIEVKPEAALQEQAVQKKIPAEALSVGKPSGRKLSHSGRSRQKLAIS